MRSATKQDFLVNLAVNAGFVLSLIILICVGWVSHKNAKLLVETSERQTRCSSTIATIDVILLRLTEIESLKRGFIQTSNESFLESLEQRIAKIDSEIIRLEQIAPDKPLEREQASQLAALASMRVALVREAIDYFRNNPDDTAKRAEFTMRGQELMDKIRGLAGAIEESESADLTRLEAQAKASLMRTRLVFSLGIIVALSITTIGGFLINRHLVARRRAEGFLQKANEILEDRVKTRTAQLTLANQKLQAEIAERQQTEQQLSRANRALRMISDCNQQVVRSTDETELLQSICRVIVDSGGYRFAWIGYAEDDAAKSIRPAAYAGHEAGYLQNVRITWDASALGLGPGGQAVKTGKPAVVNDVARDASFEPWRAEALNRGYASAIALPIMTDLTALGVLAIYAAEPGAFGAEEVSLLAELANDLAFGIKALRASENLRQSESRLQLQFDRMPVGCIVWTAEFTVASWNPAAEAIFGYTAAEAIGKHSYDLIVPAQVKQHVEGIWERLIEGDETAQSVNENVTKDGRTILCNWSNVPLRQTGGKVIGVLSMVRDITEQECAKQAIAEHSRRLEEMVEQRTREVYEAQEQLVRHERLAVLGKLASSVGHELRNPLGVINNAVYYLNLVLPKTDETVRQYLDILANEIRTSNKIVTDLLDFSRVKAPEREPVRASELIENVLGHYPLPQNVEVSNNVERDLPPLYVDTLQIKQVLGNLVTNACQAMSQGGRLALGAQAENDSVLISVGDTGCGIPSENLSKIFQPLFTTKAKGIGLGLAISKNLVESNGGSIHVESREGRGSVFTVRLPTTETKK